MSIEDAVNAMTAGKHISGKKVFIRVSTPGIDKDYIESSVEAWIVHNDGLVALEEESADVILRVISQTSGSDIQEAKWCIPIVLPSPQNALSLTTIDFYRSRSQVSRCRLWAYGLDPGGRLLFTQKPVLATHYVASPELFGVSIGKRSDLVELRVNQGEYVFLDKWRKK